MIEAGALAEIYDIDLEQACIGAMLTDNHTIPRVQARCNPGDFYDPMHQRIVATIFKECDAGKIATPLTVAVLMRSDRGLIEIGQLSGLKDGGKGYLRNLAFGASPIPNVEEYAKIIADLADKRGAQVALIDARDQLEAGSNIGDVLSPIIQVSDQAQARDMSLHDSRPIDAAADALLRELEQGQQRPEGIHASTGLLRLDEFIGGLYPKTLTVIGGRPGMGKSIVGTTICRAAAYQGWAPHLFSLEMSGREVGARMMADLAFDPSLAAGQKPLIYSRLLHHKPMTDSEWDRAIVAAGELRSLHIEVNDRDRLTIAQIAGLARARAARHRHPNLVVVDHLHIIDPGERYGGRRVDEITEITKASKQLAKRMDCPVVLLAQLNRAVEGREDKVPVMSDFRDSGSVEQDADVILGLFRPAYYAAQVQRLAKTEEARGRASVIAETKKHVLQIEILKNRNGPTQTVDCWIDVAAAAVRDHDPYKPKPADAQALLQY